MIKNWYRQVASTRAPYISGLASGKSQGTSDGLTSSIGESLELSFSTFHFHDIIDITINDNIERIE